MLIESINGLVDNPGPFVHEAVARFSTPAAALFACLALVGGAVWIGCMFLVPGRGGRNRRGYLTGVLLGGLTLAGGVGGYAHLVVTANDARDAATATAHAQYDASVISWLSAGYGITVDHAALRKLYDGDALVVDYDGGETLIEFAARADRGMAVRVPDGKLLAPLSD